MTDSIKIFSVTFCTLVTVYRTCKIAEDAFKIVTLSYNFFHAALRCSSFRFLNSNLSVAEMYKVVCY